MDQLDLLSYQPRRTESGITADIHHQGTTLSREAVVRQVHRSNPPLLTGKQLRDQGIAKVTSNSSEWVHKAREVALMLAALNGETDSDEVQAICPRPSDVHCNATGAVFKDKRFKFVGFKQTDRASGHARTIKLWGLA